ncbi:MAG: Abi family protein [Bacilli bacterium]|nr:Abi family protein [Bacilli bacterium]
MAKMNHKIFKTIDEQVDILRARGLVINDEEKVRDILFRENYFFISGYRHMFTEPGSRSKFLDGTSFEELYAVFSFDRRIRNTFFKNILIVENNIKSIISYHLSKKYGFKEKDYLNPDNFTQDKLADRQVNDILNKVRRQIRVNGRKHTATMHYIDNYGYIPMWILVKVLSFGTMAEFYGILKREDQQSIASAYGLDAETLEIYLTILANFRNVCAHEDILYDHRTQRMIPDCKYHNMLNINMVEDIYEYGKNDLFCLVIMLKFLLREDDFNDLISELRYEVEILDEIVDTVSLESILNKIGFPINWYDIKELN